MIIAQCDVYSKLESIHLNTLFDHSTCSTQTSLFFSECAKHTPTSEILRLPCSWLPYLLKCLHKGRHLSQSFLDHPIWICTCPFLALWKFLSLFTALLLFLLHSLSHYKLFVYVTHLCVYFRYSPEASAGTILPLLSTITSPAPVTIPGGKYSVSKNYFQLMLLLCLMKSIPN